MFIKKYILLLIVFSFNLFGYEYLIYRNENAISYNYFKYIYYVDSSGILKCKTIRGDGTIGETNAIFFSTLNNIHRINSTITITGYISRYEFSQIYKNDINLINDLYIQCTDAFLNYLYNESLFSASNYISYEYELFYNEDGLAVESKVDGIYKGLYDDIGQSGILYNSIGEVVLVNGVEPSFLQKQWFKLQNKIINPLLSVFSISNLWKNILCVVVILASLRMIIRYAFKAFLIRLYSKRIKHYENTITRIENA